MPGAQSRVLVVEDDVRLAATLQRVLAAEGHDVEVAGDGAEALRCAKLRTPDLAVLDVMLPDQYRPAGGRDYSLAWQGHAAAFRNSRMRENPDGFPSSRVGSAEALLPFRYTVGTSLKVTPGHAGSR